MSIIPGGRERNLISSVDFTIGAEAANVINVGIQLNGEGAGGAQGGPINQFGYVLAYLSDDSGGDGVSAAAPDGGVAIGTDGSIIAEVTADLVFILQSEADGDIDLNITDTTGTPTWHLVVILPNGEKAVSGAITFA